MTEQKLLTISVAAYNGADTLAKALESCLVEKKLNELEVLVVDDGSTDNTAAIARQYVRSYPDVFRLIQKENGGYGTTINRTIAEAKGKYYRTLDCDDWFSRPALQALLDELQGCRADAVVTDYQTVCGGTVQKKYSVCDGFARGTLYESSSFQEFPSMEMHALTFRTEMLRRAGIDLPAHCNYTDMLYTFCAMTEVQTVAFCPVTLYNYLLGRDGQSVSLESYRKHMGEYMQVTYSICDRALRLGANYRPFYRRAKDVAQQGIELFLRFPQSETVWAELTVYDRMLCRYYHSIAWQMRSKNTFVLRLTNYYTYPLLKKWTDKKGSRRENRE